MACISPSRSPLIPTTRQHAVSVVVITLNAAHQIGPCLASAAFADELLVVDSGSSDGTLELAGQHGARVLQREWLGFGPQKQFAVDQARHDWVLCLDADERVSEALRASIEQALALPEYKAYAMPRCNRFMGRWLRHGEGYPDRSVRLFQRDFARWSDDPVHEKVVTESRVGQLAGDLLHDSADDLNAYLAKQNRYTTLQAETLFAKGERAGLIQLVASPLARFVKFYVLRRGFMDGVPGLVHVALGCCNSFIKYAKLIDLTQKKKYS